MVGSQSILQHGGSAPRVEQWRNEVSGCFESSHTVSDTLIPYSHSLKQIRNNLHSNDSKMMDALQKHIRHALLFLYHRDNDKSIAINWTECKRL